ncbi:MAG: flagellar filament outer layer protein FlaA [Spirochaetia bacterium]|nr:flagellar filament outer layer protein FlaA [Spirochaetia bacterium]
MYNKTKKTLLFVLGFVFLMQTRGIMPFDAGKPTDVDSRELRTVIVEGWESTPWVISPDPGGDQSTVETKLLDGAPKDLSLDAGNKKSFGVRFQFIFPGDNKLVMTPPADKMVTHYLQVIDDKTGKQKEVKIPGIELPGIVKALSVWVLGRGEDYTMEAWIEDGKGDTHIFKFGNINFVGWRPLTVTIPNNVVQENDTYPQTNGLILKKIIVRSTAKTKANKTVLAFDSLKVLTDMNQVFFDGADINFDDADKEEKARMKKYVDQLKNSSQGSNSPSSTPNTK